MSPGGGPLTHAQWLVLDELAESFTRGPDAPPSIRFTTRQNVQFHWVKKENVVELVRRLAESGMFTLNGCGDNTRNVMACPLGKFSEVFDGNAWAHKTAEYFQLPADPFIQIFAIDPNYLRKEGENPKSFGYGKNLLNRKFKIAFSQVLKNAESGLYELDNCVEALTNDMGIVPLLEQQKLAGFQIYVGGGQGEKNGKLTAAMLGKPVCAVPEDKLLDALDAVVAVHQEWGDRQNRHWARVKYVIKAQGVEWYREQMEERLGWKLDKPIADYDIGPRMLHHGWNVQESDGRLAYGLFVENGRVVDGSPNGDVKRLVGTLLEKYDTGLVITPNQDALFTNLTPEVKEDFEADLAAFGHGKRNGKAFSTLRLLSGACVGRDTCRLTYTDSEKFEPELLDQLDALGWGDMHESIGITGCERQCFRPSTKTIGLVGSGLNRYQLRLMGSEDGRHQGGPLLSEDKSVMYMKSIPREQVASVIDALFKHYEEKREDGESMGYFHRRIGMEKIIAFLKTNPETAQLMEKPAKVKAHME